MEINMKHPARSTIRNISIQRLEIPTTTKISIQMMTLQIYIIYWVLSILLMGSIFHIFQSQRE
jgi:hypothetical protein